MMKHDGRLDRRTLLGLVLPSCVLAQSGTPYLDKRRIPLEYPGPGREDPDPTDLSEVRLGYFGPADAAHPVAGTLWMGAAFAVEEANAAGGYKGKPFRLVSRWSDDPWRGGASAVVKLAYTDQVWGIIGGIDGATTHLAEQVVAKALLPLVDPASTDQTVNAANVPWMFSLAPTDAEIAGYLAAAAGGRATVLIAGTDHDSRMLASAAMKAFGAQGVRVLSRQDVTPGAGSLPTLETAAEAYVVIAPPVESAMVVKQLPAQATVAGGPAAATRRFREAAGPAGERVLVAQMHAPALDLEKRIAARYSQPCDAYSLLGYDAAAILLRAVSEAGLNRAKVRDRLAAQFGPRGRGVQTSFNSCTERGSGVHCAHIAADGAGRES